MKIALIVCLLSGSLSAACQLSQVSFSEDFKVVNHEYRDQTITNSLFHNNSFYTVTNPGIGMGKWLFTKLYDVRFDLSLTQFDRNMNEVREVKLENGAKDFGPLPPSLFLMNNKLFVVYFKSENKTSFDMFISRVDESSLTIAETKKICNIKQENVGVFKFQSVLTGGLVFVCNSISDEKTLIACKVSTNKLQTFIVDSNLGIEKQTDIPTSDSKFKISSAVLTKDNLQCMVLESELDTKIVYVSPDGKKGQKIFNGLGAQKPYSTHVKPARNGKWIYIYASTNPTGLGDESCNGLEIAQFDCTTLQVSKPVLYKFSIDILDIIAQRDGKSERRSKDYTYSFIPFLIELDNDRIAVLGSPTMLQESTHTMTDSRGRMETKVKTELNVGPVITFFPTKEGASLKHVLIPRKIGLAKSSSGGSGVVSFVQVPGISSSSLGFVAKNIGDKIVVLYNDNETNLTRSEDKKAVASKNTKSLVLAEAVVLGDGSLQYRKQIGENIKGSATYYLGEAVQNSSNQVIFPIGREGVGFTKQVFSNWCFIKMGE